MPVDFNTNIDQEQLMGLFSQLQGILNQDRNQTDPLLDLSPFRVSATRGRAMFPMGGTTGGLPSIPATFMMDTINNTPSNLPGGAAGKFPLSQISMQQNDVFTVPTSLPFGEATFGNKLLQPTPFHRLKSGGRVDERLARLLERKQRLEAKGKTGGKRFQNILDRIADINIGGQGKTGFGNALIDVGGGIGEGLSAAGKIAGIFHPGLGMAAQAVGKPLGTLNDRRQSLGQGRFGTGFGNIFGGGLSAFGAGDSQFQNPNQFQNQGQLLGQTPFGSNFGTPFPATPGIAGPMFNSGSLLTPLMSFGSFQEGGAPSAVPIQTEVGEMIVLPDIRIVDVNATKKHKQMDKDEVTDITPDGAYILSNNKDIVMKKKDAEKLVMGFKSEEYSEFSKAMVPEEITYAWLWGESNKDKTPAELGRKIRSKFPTRDKEELFGYSDPFTDDTNSDNLESRMPWLDVAIAFNESKRVKREPLLKFKHGGKVKRPLRIKNVRKAPVGGDISQILNVLGNALPFLNNLIGGGSQNSSVDPLTQSLALSSLPIDQAAFQANVNARDNALGQGISDFNGLGQNLNQLAVGTAGAGILGNLAQNTNLPRFDFSSARSRLNNFNTRTPRAFAEALATPRFDTRAVLQELGPRRGGTALAALGSDQQRTLNSSMINQFNSDRNLDFTKTQGLNQLDIGEQDRNIPLELQEIQARNAQTSGVFGQFGDLFNRMGQIQSNILPVTTGLNLQRANLVGQPGMRSAQNLLNASTLLGSFQGPGQQQSQQQGGGNFLSSLGNIGSSLQGLFGSNNSGGNSGSGLSILDGFSTRTQPTLPILEGLNGLQFPNPGVQFGNQCYDPVSGTFRPC